MFDIVIGLGQGGGRLAKEFADQFKIQGCYVNLADVDFANFDVSLTSKLVIKNEGTGRNAALGEKWAVENIGKIRAFISGLTNVSKLETVCLCVGGGGGSGTGMLIPVVELLLEMKEGIKIVVFYTLPRKIEGLPAKPQAFKYLNLLIIKCLNKSESVSLLLVDNDFCLKLYSGDGVDTDFAYWVKVNRGVVKTIKTFYDLTQLDRYDHIDTASGIGAVDLNELKRVMFFGGGFTDIKDFEIEYPDSEKIVSKIKESGKLSNLLDTSTCKAYVISIALPDRWKTHDCTNTFVDDVLTAVARMTKTTYVLRSSFYSKRLDNARIMIMLSGLTEGKGLEKLIAQTRGDEKKFEDKGKMHIFKMNKKGN
jgi:cell division GTPase FtsZ